MEQVPFNWIKDIPAWGTFLGTISISILAMFSNRLKNWFCRPKLSCDIDNTRKYCEIVDDESDSNKVDDGVPKADFVWCIRYGIMCGVRRDQVMTDENQITLNSAGNGIEPSSVASSQSAPASSVVIDQSSVAASQSCETHNAGSIRRKETRPRRSKGLGGLQQEKTGSGRCAYSSTASA